MTPRPGICPRCGGAGSVAEACSEPACRAEGRHHVPPPPPGHARSKSDPRLGTIIGDHLLIEVLSESAFSTVYLALQLPLLMKTALKTLRPRDGDVALQRALAEQFQKEAAALAALVHPNTVRLLKYGVHGETPYLAMEYLEGSRTLEEVMQEHHARGERLPLEAARAVLTQVAHALEAAHRAGLVHGDVKPANLAILRLPGEPLHVRLLDFGLARLEGAEGSFSAGTPAYMAPEQVSGTQVGPWTDRYALAVLTYEMIFGRLPFPAREPSDILALKTDPSFDPVQAIRDVRVSSFVVGFFRRALAREPSGRHPSDREFRETLEWVFDALGDALTVGFGDEDAASEQALLSSSLASAPPRPGGGRDERLLDELRLDLATQSRVYRGRRPSRFFVGSALAALVLTLGFLAGAWVGDWSLDQGAERVAVTRGGDFPAPSAPDVALVPADASPDAGSIEDVPPAPLPTAPAGDTIPEQAPPQDAPPPEPADAPQVPGVEWVTLPARGAMTRAEIPRAAYRACVDALVCTPPAQDQGCLPLSEGADQLPVACVDAFQAAVFCRWVGGRLPSPEEWIAAATAGDDRAWPWGRDAPTCARVVMDEGGPGCGTGSPAPACSRPAGASPDGLCDLVGNVSEWTDAREDEDAVFLGGGWRDTADLLDVHMKGLRRADRRDPDLGFRCAQGDQDEGPEATEERAPDTN